MWLFALLCLREGDAWSPYDTNCEAWRWQYDAGELLIYEELMQVIEKLLHQQHNII